MSIARKITNGASGSGGSETYVDDVFSNTPYTGSSATTQRITNNIALADKAGDLAVNSLRVNAVGTNTELTGLDWSAATNIYSSDFSIELWVRHLATPSLMFIIDGRGNLNDTNMVLYWEGSTLALAVGTNVIKSAGSAPNYSTAGDWNHVVWTRRGGRLAVFVNGIKYGSTVTDTISLNVRFADAQMFNTGLAAAPLKNVEIQDFRICKGVTVYDPEAATIEVPTERLEPIDGTSLLLFNGGETLDEMLTNKAPGQGEQLTQVGSAVVGLESSAYPSSPEEVEGKGGLVWIKNRGGAYSHQLVDTERGQDKYLSSDLTDGEITEYNNRLQDFTSDGFFISDSDHEAGKTSSDYISWTFAKQEGFFDVVTYTGEVSGPEAIQTVPHNLGSVPAMIIVKCTNDTGGWFTYHKDLGKGKFLALDSSNDASADMDFWGAVPTDTEFYLKNGNVNGTPREFVAYLFAHDAPMFGPDGDESIIKCGSYVGTGVDSTAPVIDLGWEPQWLLIKNADANGTDWVLLDSMRGLTVDASATDAKLYANDARAESLDRLMGITSTGFFPEGGDSKTNGNGNTHIYMAIRRPNKPAEEFQPDELFATALREDATSDYESGFPVDMVLNRNPTAVASNFTQVGSRLKQGQYVYTSGTASSGANFYMEFDSNTRWGYNVPENFQSWMFRRAPGFFDVVTYEGGQGTDAQIPHSLNVRPEMIWIKNLSESSEWSVWAESYENTNQQLILNRSAALGTSYFGSMPEVMTDEVFQIGGNAVYMNGAGKSYIAYLWASVPGICDIGTYTGTGDWQYIDCGFDTAIPRFVLIKAASESGDWYYWDTLRGIVSGNDPYLLLNSTAAQVTNQNWISPSPQGEIGGFYLNSSSSSEIYKDGVEYIYMAIA